MSADLVLSFSILPRPRPCFGYATNCQRSDRFDFNVRRPKRRRPTPLFRAIPNLTVSGSLEIRPEVQSPQFLGPAQEKDSPILLDVTGMMCGACVSRVKSLLSADERVDSAVVNMLTETAAVRLKPEAVEREISGNIADSLARRLSDCGFESKRRVSGMGVAENVEKWREMVRKKDELLVKSRNRVAFAWTLVALCCGSHASHVLHSLGIHVAHGSFVELLHNSYVKGALALGALLGPGRG
uniref:HMA domain-containing protein n=1 Tax=Rhizophora mucronata TaxID=61149 RepID=A0A2P2KJR3_RHIMU